MENIFNNPQQNGLTRLQTDLSKAEQNKSIEKPSNKPELIKPYQSVKKYKSFKQALPL